MKCTGQKDKSYSLDKVATGSYIFIMYISVKDAKDQLSDLLHRAEAGEKIILTRHGKPVAEIGPIAKKGGINFAALEAIKKELGVEKLVSHIAPDFDDPFPEDYLITATSDPQ
jgi:prevent-host-death family protein